MNTIVIHNPIWKDRSVGIDEAKMTTMFRVIVPYKKKCGEYLYPNAFYFNKEQGRTYPTQTIRGVTLRIIPLADMTIGERVPEEAMEDARNGRFEENPEEDVR